MKIEKQILLRAKIEHIRALLNDNGLFQCDYRDHIRTSRDHKNPASVQILSIGFDTASTSEFCWFNKDDSPINAKFELSEKGKRIMLKVTISGWENVDPDKARIEMPKVSLRLEKKLSSLKKVIEASE